MVFYSNVPLAEEKKCPSHLDHNRLARQFNLRLKRFGPDCAWRIFYYADSIFLGMRNTATPQVPLGISPAEDEWWKVYMNIEYPTGTTGEGNWPMAFAGTPQGANVMNPLNAFIFGRKTAENKKQEKLGPWAEGNNFDGIVNSTRAVLSNRQYWESSFSQRGAAGMNFQDNQVDLSKGLFSTGRKTDEYFVEYASNAIYMRYPPAIKHGVYVKYGEAHLAPAGVLKRKNAAKDLLNWGLWVYTYYFRGAEQQRSLFCDGGGEAPFTRPWSSDAIDVNSDKKYAGQQTPYITNNDSFGPLSICRVGFDFYKYFTRQNVFAPVLGDLVESDGVFKDRNRYKKLDGTGNLKIEKYRVTYKYEIPIVTSSADSDKKENRLAFCHQPIDTISAFSAELENYDRRKIGGKDGFYGKTVRFKKEVLYKEGDSLPEGKKIGDVKEAGISKAMWNESFLMKCSYESFPARREPSNAWSPNSNKGLSSFSYKGLTSSGTEDAGMGRGLRPRLDGCLAGYYLQTTAVENSNMQFKLRIWGGSKIVHETIIKHKYSYAVNRNADASHFGKRAYVFNKMYYFKEGLDYSSFRFEIVPVLKDGDGTGLISFGNSFSSTVEASYRAATKESFTNDKIANLTPQDKWFLYDGKGEVEETSQEETPVAAKSYLVHEAAAPYLTTGDMVKIKYQYLKGNVSSYLGLQRAGGPVSMSDDTTVSGYVLGGEVFFVRKEEKGPVISISSITEDSGNATVESANHNLETGETVVISGASPTAYNNLFSVTVVDDDTFEISVESGLGNANGNDIKAQTKPESARLYFYERQDDRLNCDIKFSGPVVNLYEALAIASKTSEFKDSRHIIIEKMQPPAELFNVTLDLAILAKAKPTFHDLYALLRTTTDKQNRRNTSSNIILGDGKGIGTVGHHFTESKRVWRNYYKYGSGMNIYGSSVVPALRMYVSANPIYESMRKFISSYMRFADRRELINYTVEGGRGVLYFKRYCWGLPRKAKATVLRNMEPSVEPAGWFDKGVDAVDSDSIGHAKFVPIKKGKSYRVVCEHKSGVGVVYNKILRTNGVIFEGGSKEHLDSVVGIDPRYEGAFEINGINNSASSSETNQWIMFMTSSHYNTSSTSIYKPSVFNDIMGFLNNRCHHRSIEYERREGDQYDMIRTELCRVMPGPRTTPGPRLHIFMSKSSSNQTYVFNTNDPYQGNLHLYAEHSIPPYDYFRSCPPLTPEPYKVISTQVVSSRANGSVNLSFKTINDTPPSEIVKVVLNRPLRGTGRLGLGRNGWRSVNRAKLQKEPYRTDENAVIEYLHHLAGNYSCKRNMIGDHGADSNVVEGVGYRPYGACYPRFYFLKLIPLVVAGAILNTDPYAQMDFYLRAMGGAFINPYATPIYAQTSALNWQFGELASRSVEEDPTLYNYVDPRSIQS